MDRELTFEELIYLLENPTRRKILEAIAREGHYPLQLSHELKVSQQAIAKHLNILEDYGLVECVEEESSMGPKRKYYRPSKHYSFTIDVGPNLFNVTYHPYEAKEVDELRLAKESEAEQRGEKLTHLSRKISEINQELERLEETRTQLIQEKEMLLAEAQGMIEDATDEYDERRVLHYVINRNAREVEGIADALEMREKVIHEMMRKFFSDFY